MKVEPRLVSLLRKSGIELQRNCRLPSPPAICEVWWGQAEKIIKKNKRRSSQDMVWVTSAQSLLKVRMKEMIIHKGSHATWHLYMIRVRERSQPPTARMVIPYIKLLINLVLFVLLQMHVKV
jgi:hypothetical protein